VDGNVILSPIGQAVAEEWLRIPLSRPWIGLDEWVVMPDHMHGILIFRGETDGPRDSNRLQSRSLGTVIGQFKADATRRIWGPLKRPDFAWQTRFHDVILRKSEDLERVRAYIRQNPANWTP
jgi:putative transposase